MDNQLKSSDLKDFFTYYLWPDFLKLKYAGRYKDLYQEWKTPYEANKMIIWFQTLRNDVKFSYVMVGITVHKKKAVLMRYLNPRYTEVPAYQSFQEKVDALLIPTK